VRQGPGQGDPILTRLSDAFVSQVLELGPESVLCVWSSRRRLSPTRPGGHNSFRPEPTPSPSGEISQSLIAHGHSQTHEARDGDHVTGQDPVARKLRMRSELKFWFVLR
jgi:hypothetical protein